jgi:hypothetical protein
VIHTAGNAYFRQVVAEQLNDFKYHQSQKNRHGMSMVVQRIVQKVHETGGRFMDQNWRGMVRCCCAVHFCGVSVCIVCVFVPIWDVFLRKKIRS